MFFGVFFEILSGRMGDALCCSLPFLSLSLSPSPFPLSVVSLPYATLPSPGQVIGTPPPLNQILSDLTPFPQTTPRRIQKFKKSNFEENVGNRENARNARNISLLAGYVTTAGG